MRGFLARDGDLLELVRRTIHGSMRFIEPNGAIQEAQAHMTASVEGLQQLLLSPDGASDRLQDQMRREACRAVDALKQAIFQHGCASAAADRVGPGVQGKSI